MKLSEIIARVGDENIQLQNLQRDLVSVDTGKKDGKITFTTERSKTLNLAACCVNGDKPQFTGLVLWLPTELVNALLTMKREPVKSITGKPCRNE